MLFVVNALLASLSIMGLMMLFSFICVICDKHLIPCVEIFVKAYKIPEEVAGFANAHVAIFHKFP
jgi:hypothetical protein